jgi:hypothetical protein
MLNRYEITANLSKIEDSNRSKFGPRSLAKPWAERKESLLDYFRYNTYPDDPFTTKASGRLRPTSLTSAGDRLIKSSNSGLPYLQRKGIVLDDAISSFGEQYGVYPCMLYTRTQEERKTRNVWGFPISDTLQELQYFIPYFEVEKYFRHRSALRGPDFVDTMVSKLILEKPNDHLMVSVDFSSYDASVSPEHSHAAFQNVARAFQAGHEVGLFELWKRFITIPVYTPDGEKTGIHGVPSGSVFTNTIDSEVQYLVSGREYSCEIQGDDGIYRVPVSDLSDFYKRFNDAGLKLNEDKSETFDAHEGVYLQRYYNPLYRRGDGSLGGVYSIFRAMARIKYLERWTDFDKMKISGADFFSLRTIMILENCKHHPCFVELVLYAQSTDKYGLQFTAEGLNAYSRSMESKTRAGVFNQFGDEVGGINDFETVKVLKTL